MSDGIIVVSTKAELAAAATFAEDTIIEVKGAIEHAESLRLRPGQRLRGLAGASITFLPGQDGLVLSADNTVETIELRTEPTRRAICNDTSVRSFGNLALHNLRTTGCVHVFADDATEGGHVEVRDLHVVEADARWYEDRAPGFGVEVIPGVFSLRNKQISGDSLITADLRGISAGRPDAPVRGTGVLVGGTPGGGRLVAAMIETGEIHSDGGIAPGTPDRISGGVFVVQGVEAQEVRNAASVTTYGPNDMVLDNWGVVERWHALKDATSHGASGIGFVNLGQLGTLTIDGVLETKGVGACGFNSGEVSQDANVPTGPEAGPTTLAGALREAVFGRIVTRGDGAIGIQISVPAGRISVRAGIETFGGVGASLARGVVTKLPAVALSVKPGGSAEELDIDGGLTTHGAGIEAIELHGRIRTLRVAGSIGPSGGGFSPV